MNHKIYINRFLKSLAKKLLRYSDLNIKTKSNVKFLLQQFEDIRLFSEIVMKDCYGSFLESIEYPQTICDLGCNCGFFSLYLEEMRRELYSNLNIPKVLMLDANPIYVDDVNRSIVANNLEDYFFVKHGLVGPRDTAQQFSISKSPARSSTLMQYAAEKKLTLASINLDAISQTFFPNGMDLLKIDIEGAEKYFFLDWGNFLKKAKYIIIEYHEFSVSYNEVESALKYLNFNLIRHNSDKDNTGCGTALFKQINTFI
jgi:FkbM family methyltransferase